MWPELQILAGHGRVHYLGHIRFAWPESSHVLSLVEVNTPEMISPPAGYYRDQEWRIQVVLPVSGS
jgi:hypothetical protein